MTIINPHDMTRHYSLWGFCLVLTIVMAALMYWYQPALLWPDVPAVLKTIIAGIAGLCALVAISFKFVFAQEMIAWLLMVVVALGGTATIGLFGYHDGWLLYYGVAFVGLFVFGPYLHFD